MKNPLFPVLILLCCLQAAGQQAVTNNGALQIHPGGNMTVFGSFSNTAPAGWLNNGNVYLKSDVSNQQPLMAAGLGTLFMNGTVLQTLSGSQPFNTFNLNTNNAGGILLGNSLSVSGTHSFVNGIIGSVSAANFLAYEAGASYSAESNASHVSGWIKKSGSTDFSFPLGNGTVLRKAGISNLSGPSVFIARYLANTPNRNNLQSPLVAVNPNEYWEINKLSGGSAQVVLNWDNSQVGFPNYLLAEIKTGQNLSEFWTETGGTATGTTATNGTITSSPLSSFGLMVIGSSGFALPLRFLGLSARRLPGFTRVEWKTAGEENLRHYEVQRTTGQQFATIATLYARNNRLEQRYRYQDSAALSGMVYYRIRSVDLDGRVAYSGIVAVQINNQNRISVINPAGDRLQLVTGRLPQAMGAYKIFTGAGHLLASGSVQLGGSLSEIPLPGMAAGGYILLLQYGNEQFSAKFTKQ